MKKTLTVTAEIIPIGNSLGVRIPKPLREQAKLSGKVSMTASDSALVIRSLHKPRQGWAEAFARKVGQRPDEAVWPDRICNVFDDEEWTW